MEDPDGMRRTRWLGLWVAVALAVVVLAVVLLVATRPDAAPIVAGTPSPGPSARTSALFVGDAYVLGRRSFARQTCVNLGWTCRIDGRAGSGYVAGTRYADRLAADSGFRPDVVVVTGGRSDVGRAGVRAAVRRYVSAVGTRFPDADVVVVEPFWNDDVNYPEVTRTRTDVQLAAVMGGAAWIPTFNWIRGSANFTGGGKDLTAAGDGVLAARLTTALRSR